MPLSFHDLRLLQNAVHARTSFGQEVAPTSQVAWVTGVAREAERAAAVADEVVATAARAVVEIAAEVGVSEVARVRVAAGAAMKQAEGNRKRVELEARRARMGLVWEVAWHARLQQLRHPTQQ